MYKLLVFALSAIALIENSFLIGAENKPGLSYGSQKYGKETLSFIEGNGLVVLEGTRVNGLVEVNGSLTARGSVINHLQVNGGAKLSNTVVKDDSLVNGSLIADNTHFKKNLSVASQKVSLKKSTVDSLTVRKILGYEGEQIIDLQNGTTVTGPITVESGKGEIWVSSNSRISESQVTGAKIYRK